MRKRIWITCAVALTACLLFLLFKATRQQKTALPEQGEPFTAQSGQPQQPKATENRQQPNTSQTTAVPPVADAPKPTSWTSNSVWERTLINWQSPIEFYGKVVDENGNAISGVSIHFRWIETPAEDGERTADTQSDSDGLFSLHGKLGRSLTVWFSKEGYFSSHRGQMGFLYALGPDIHSPDPQNPVIFNLRKKGQGAELITSENGAKLKLNVRIPRDNTPVRVDLLQKQANAAGQLEISQSKPPSREATEWSFRMSIPSGGFIENADEFQFEAPEANYLPTVEYRFTKGETNWTTQVSKQFYITFGQPRKFGWIRIESNLAQETIFLTYAINPNGARTLEPQ